MVVKNIRFHNFSDKMYVFGDESRSWNPCFRDWGARIHHIEQLSFTNVTKKLIKW